MICSERRSNILRFTLATTLFICSSGAESQAQVGFDRVVEHIQEKMGRDRDDAEAILLIIYSFVQDLQFQFTYIASSSDSYEAKIPVVKETIGRYFLSPHANIQVSSRTRGTVSDYSVSVYLDNLARLRSHRGYTKVELAFDPDYVGIGAIERTSQAEYQLSVNLWQTFKGWRDNRVWYSDATQKKFRLIIESTRDSIDIKIKEIKVSETVDLELYRSAIKPNFDE